VYCVCFIVTPFVLLKTVYGAYIMLMRYHVIEMAFYLIIILNS